MISASSPRGRLAALLLSLVVLPASAFAQPLVANGDFTAPLAGTWNFAVKPGTEPRVVDAKIDGAPDLKKALHFELKPEVGAYSWDARVVAPKTAVAIAKGDMLLVRFWARSTPKTRILAVYQESVQPYGKSIRENLSLRPEWKQFTFYGPAKSSYAAGGSNFEFQIGQATGVLELAGLQVENLGRISVDEARNRFGPIYIDYYGGEEPDDNWIPAAEARIEKIRKGDLKLRIVGKDGKPVSGAEIIVKQTKSSFRWGSAVNSRLLEETPDGDKYREMVKKLYNTAVVENELKWKASDNRPEVQARGRAMIDWLRANDIAVRGHNLVWGSPNFLPQRINDLSPEAAKEEVRKRVVDAVTAYKGQLYVWDVVNEAGSNTQLFDKIGWDQFADVFRLTKATDPSVQTCYNDYNIANEATDNGALRVRVEARIKTLLDAGAPVDYLGDQAHIFVPITPIPRVLEIWDEWGKKYMKPIEITEYDLGVADDAVHAKYTKDFLIAAFSNPNIDAFLFWGFWEKAHWRGYEGCMFRADWSPRPAELAYEDLVLNKWRTNQILKTDKDGIIQTRGFLGDYEIQINAGGLSKTLKLNLPKAGAKQQISLN